MNSLVVVDIQPEYHEGIKNITLEEFTKYLNEFRGDIYYYWVGEGLTNDTELSIYLYLIENGLSEDTINNITFIEKDYGWIRGEMEMDYHFINKKLFSGEVDYAIDLLRELPDNFYICGGGRDECLAEMEHTMNFMGFNYERIERFIY